MTIHRSDQLNELFSALSKLQGKLEMAKKDKAGYNNNYKYAELSQYIEISKELLEEHGLCVLQMPGAIEIVEVTKEIYDKKTQTYVFHNIMIPKQKITTEIGHESGQFISSSMEILVEKMASNSWGQSTGVAISFARRYARAGGLGMSQEDNDNQLPKKEVEKHYDQVNSSTSVDYERIDADKVKYLTSLLKDDSERLKKILLWAKVEKIEDLSIIAYTTAVNRLIAEQKGIQIPSNNDTNLISETQVAFVKRLVTPERLNKILQDYKLNKLEEMSLADFHKEYDKLRLEMTTNIEYSSITQTN